jgi:hypothetical protein
MATKAEQIQSRIDKYRYMMDRLIVQQRGCSQLYWNLNDTVRELKAVLAQELNPQQQKSNTEYVF